MLGINWLRMRLLIAADVDRTFIERISADPRFAVRHQPVKTEAELAAIVGDAQVLVTRAYNKVSRRVLDAAPQLELIAQGTSGTDNIDDAAARERGIPIISLPGENANAVAELVIGYLLAMTRTIPQYTREVVTGIWSRDDCATRHELRHYRLGIVGLGEVGKRVARLASAFSMEVIAYDPYLDAATFAERHARPVATLSELLAACDILTVHVPLTDATRRMIGAGEIASLHRGAYLVSAARGEIVDQQAALTALANGHLAGLAMDVYDPEPPTTPFPN
ncbi:MAG: D-3-phosphoglycerate dehydrogenase / 2-oxoglutarate reductase, partial [Acidobacteriota bacterium]|nr:D-3-phosphoglycerate dehydrogenase / 2-oxoglutarate reductase [Acidobacteriota bacterium]